MKKSALIRHLRRFGCVLLEEGSKHSRWVNPADRSKQCTIPRHSEIDDLLARLICRKPGVPPPK